MSSFLNNDKRFKQSIKITLILLISLSLILSGCGSNNSPEGVAKNFINSIVKGKGEEAAKLCAGSKMNAMFLVGVVRLGLSMETKEKPKFSYETLIDGDYAEVGVTTEDGYFCTIELEKINENWKVVYVQ